jgi:hypothetical protein
MAVGELRGRGVIFSGGDDKSIRIWDLDHGEPIREPLTGHGGWVAALAVGELNGRTVLVSGGALEGGVRVWDPAAGRQISTHPATAEGSGGNEAVYALDVAEIEGRPVVVSGSYKKGIQFWNLEDGTPAGGPLLGHEGPVKSVVWSAWREGPIVVSGGEDSSVRVWPLPAGLPGAGLGDDRAVVAYGVTLNTWEGQPVICAFDEDWTLRILDLDTGRLVREPLSILVDGPRNMYVFGLLRDRPILLVFDTNSYLLGIRDLVANQWAGASMQVHFKKGGYFQRLYLSSLEGRPVVLVGSTEGDLWVGDLLERKQVAAWRGNPSSAIAFGEVGKRRLVAVGERGKERPIQLRNLAHGMEEGRIATRHESYLSAIGLGELSGRSVVVSEGDLRIWDLHGELLSEVQMGARIDDLFVGPESKLVVSTSMGIAVLQYHDLPGGVHRSV